MNLDHEVGSRIRFPRRRYGFYSTGGEKKTWGCKEESIAGVVAGSCGCSPRCRALFVRLDDGTLTGCDAEEAKPTAKESR